MTNIKILYITIFLFYHSHSYHFNQQSYMIPHPAKAHKGGQDAFYSHQQILVVSDGVGGWSQYGIDPGKYSKKLCQLISQQFFENKQLYIEQPRKLMQYSHQLNEQIGSATLVIITIDPKQPLIYSSYLGDSGYIIVRQIAGQLKILYQSPQQQHRFNFPFQLTTFNLNLTTDTANQSINKIHNVQLNDIIVVASDGLLDNMHLSQIVQHLQQGYNFSTKKIQTKKQIAKKLAQIAIQNGKNSTFISPFSLKAKNANLRYVGGKLDDTTVIIAQIQHIVNMNSQL